MFPLHQQNIWESRHKAGEAAWELQPEILAHCRTQGEERGFSEQAEAVAPSLHPGCWVHGREVLGSGGLSVQDGELPKSQHGGESQEIQLSTETSLRWEQGQEQKPAKILVAPGAQQPHVAHACS